MSNELADLLTHATAHLSLDTESPGVVIEKFHRTRRRRLAALGTFTTAVVAAAIAVPLAWPSNDVERVIPAGPATTTPAPSLSPSTIPSGAPSSAAAPRITPSAVAQGNERTVTPTASAGAQGTARVQTSKAPVEAATFCRLSELSVTSGQADAAAGTIYYPILFRNTGGRTCQLRGYPGVALLDSAGRQVAQAQRISGPPDVALVTLTPGQVASAAFAAGDLPVAPATSCPDYQSVLVTPPDERHFTAVNFSFRVCSPAHIYPIVAGAGNP
jgi:hypothetical protein